MGLSSIRILEIGDHHHFKYTFFAQTKLLWTGRRRPKFLASRDYRDCTPQAFLSAMREAAEGKFDIIVVYAGQRSPWHPRYWFRGMFSASPARAAVRAFGVTWLRYVRPRLPLVVLDMHDIPTIHRSNFFLLDLAQIYFKRELPVDRWQSVCGTAHANLPTLRIRRDPRWQARIAKLHPISLQAGFLSLDRPDAEVFAAKSTDVFFAGATAANSTVRSDGLQQLRKLMQRGFKVDIAAERLSPADYSRRLSQAWLAWSPSGLGWDCYRHYEAPQCLAVPVINYPTIARDRPLQDGVHAFFYPPEGDGLSQTIESALADKEKLKQMAVAGRDHVRANHVGPAFCERVLSLALPDKLQNACCEASSPGRPHSPTGLARESAPRFLFDISTSMRWTGPPVGIVRVERELALWAHANLANVKFVFFDPNLLTYREVARDTVLFLTGDAAVDTLGLTNPATPGQRRTDRIPPQLRAAFLWIGQSRRKVLNHLERVRLSTPHRALAHFADRLQRPLMSRKYRAMMVRPDGTRRPFYPYDMAVGAPIKFGRNDTLVCAGSGWGLTNIEALSKLKAETRFCMVLMCHDLIPLMFPQFYREHDVALFRRYMHQALATADLIIANSRAVEADCRGYCEGQGIVAGKIVRSILGFDAGSVAVTPAADLPRGLHDGRFAMLVSTIEPRKGHRLLFRVWRRLLAEGVPQSRDFKLVFVGRRGWMVDDLVAEITTDPQLAEQILLIDDADDAMLAALYRGAAFCLYPSTYEGYGLPVIEAFSHGKAVLASTGGALPELVGELSPCLDPTDEQAWLDTIRRWIASPEALAPYEQAIQAHFRHPTWSEAAADFFSQIAAVNAKQGSGGGS